jgi:hypothetical protein
MGRRKLRMLDDFPDLPWLGQYILGGEEGRTPIPCYSLTQWGEWLNDVGHRQVAFTGNKTKYVSTVFLGLDHRHMGGGPPLVFESMAFIEEGKWFEGAYGERIYYPTSLDCERYSSWEDAEIGHRAMVRKYLVNQKTRAVKAE